MKTDLMNEVFNKPQFLQEIPPFACKLLIALCYSERPVYYIDDLARIIGASVGTVHNNLHYLVDLHVIKKANVGGRGKGKIEIRLLDVEEYRRHFNSNEKPINEDEPNG